MDNELCTGEFVSNVLYDNLCNRYVVRLYFLKMYKDGYYK